MVEAFIQTVVYGTIAFVWHYWQPISFLFLLFLIVVSHLLIMRRLRIVDDRVKALVQHEQNVEIWMESVRDAIVRGLE